MIGLGIPFARFSEDSPSFMGFQISLARHPAKFCSKRQMSQGSPGHKNTFLTMGTNILTPTVAENKQQDSHRPDTDRKE